MDKLHAIVFKFRIPIIIVSLGVREIEMMCLKYQAPDGHQERVLIIIAVGKKRPQRPPGFFENLWALKGDNAHTTPHIP